MQIIFACFSRICILIIFAVSLHLFFEEGEVFPYFLNYLSRVFCVLISPASRVQLRVQSHMPSRMESGGVLWMRHGVSRGGMAGRQVRRQVRDRGMAGAYAVTVAPRLLIR